MTMRISAAQKIALPILRCNQCDYTWYPRTPYPSKVCPSCRSSKWDRPKEVKTGVGDAR